MSANGSHTSHMFGKFIPAVGNQFCLNLPAPFSQPPASHFRAPSNSLTISFARQLMAIEGNGTSITCVPMLIVLRMFPGEGGGQNRPKCSYLPAGKEKVHPSFVLVDSRPLNGATANGTTDRDRRGCRLPREYFPLLRPTTLLREQGGCPRGVISGPRYRRCMTSNSEILPGILRWEDLSGGKFFNVPNIQRVSSPVEPGLG